MRDITNCHVSLLMFPGASQTSSGPQIFQMVLDMNAISP